jgi:hypothetical protein
MSQYTNSLSAAQLIDYISRDYVELSYDKIRIQRDDFMKICKDWMLIHVYDPAHAEQAEAHAEAVADQPETDYSGWADYWEDGE